MVQAWCGVRHSDVGLRASPGRQRYAARAIRDYASRAMREALGDPYREEVAEQQSSRQRLVDALVAMGLLAVCWFSTAAPTQTDPSYTFTPRDAVFAALLVLATVPYAWRRTWPATAFLLNLLATSTLWLLGYNTGALPTVLLLGAYWLALARPVRVVAVCGSVAVGCLSLLWWDLGVPFGVREMVASVLALGAAMALGRAGRLRVDLADARALAAEEAARRRAGEERLGIARELHDIVGHSLGTIAVQAGVGRHLMDTDPDGAAEALDNIARVSRDSLDEVRAVVAALRDDEPSYRPAPGLADLPELVESARLAGLSVELTLPEDVVGVPRAAGAAVYRITREALTNVVRHAHATTARVEVGHRGDRIEVAIRDDGSASDGGGDRAGRPTSGHGITGMRERAEALGGSLSAGPAAGGGFLVTATLPAGPAR
jgi:signal transduction histidine kinase